MQVPASGVHVWHLGLVHLTQSYVLVDPNKNVSIYPYGQRQSEDYLLVPKHYVQVAASGLQISHLRFVHLTQSYVLVEPNRNISIYPDGHRQSDDYLLLPKHYVQVPSFGEHVWHLRLEHLKHSYVLAVPNRNVSIYPDGQEQSEDYLLVPKH